MPKYILPTLGTKGVYELNTPFDTLVKAGVVYTCKSLTSLNSLVTNGQDPFALYYAPLELSVEVYKQDRLNDVTIIGLQTGNGSWAYVPNSYLLAMPDINGEIYRAIMIGVSLGAIPDALNLGPLKNSLSNLVFDSLGVNPVIKEISVSDPILVGYSKHEIIDNARKANIVVNMSDTARVIKAEKELALVKYRLTELETFIKNLKVTGKI